MCGIVGYAGSGEALPIVAAGLKTLEYRGYDSAGIALLDGTIDAFKSEGEIDDLDLPEQHSANIGIGHTRWSTRQTN